MYFLTLTDTSGNDVFVDYTAISAITWSEWGSFHEPPHAELTANSRVRLLSGDILYVVEEPGQILALITGSSVEPF